MMMPFDYNHKNPSRFAFHMLISDIVICTSWGLPNLNKKMKNKLNSGSCSQVMSS